MNTQNSIKKQVKERLSRALIKTGKTAKEIAKLTEINFNTVYHYMNGSNFPSMKNFDLLIERLGLDEREIMRYDLVNDIIDAQIKE